MGKMTIGFAAVLLGIVSQSCRPIADPGEIDTDSATHIILPDGPISDVFLTLDEDVSTLLTLNWTLSEDVEFTWVEFSFENEEWLVSPKEVGTAGSHREILFGLPEQTAVQIRIATEEGGESLKSETFEGMNGSAPKRMPRPTLVDYAPTLASDHSYLLGSVENSQSMDAYWQSPFYAFIIDRQARIVWYHVDVSDSRILFPRIAPSGTHILFDMSPGFLFQGKPVTLTRTTLDFEHQEQTELFEMSWGYDVTDSGHILYDYFGILKEMSPDGDIRTLWDCQDWLPSAGWAGAPSDCFSNTVSWSAARNSVLLSHPWGVHAAIEVDRNSGELLSNFGDLPFSWEFVPKDVGFDFQHYPNITGDGTLLVSSHVTNSPLEQRIMEFDIDDKNQVLTQIWSYGANIDDYADESGSATRIDNGNTLVNYGTGGVIREVTPSKETVWHVVFDADFSVPSSNNLLGHTVLVRDLFELNRGLL